MKVLKYMVFLFVFLDICYLQNILNDGAKKLDNLKNLEIKKRASKIEIKVRAIYITNFVSKSGQ